MDSDPFSIVGVELHGGHVERVRTALNVKSHIGVVLFRYPSLNRSWYLVSFLEERLIVPGIETPAPGTCCTTASQGSSEERDKE